MKKMDAKEFIELDSVAFEDVTFRQGDIIKIHIEVLYKIMEQYHQSKVNNVVLDDVSKQGELLKAFVDFYNYRNTGDKIINNDEIEIFIDSL